MRNKDPYPANFRYRYPGSESFRDMNCDRDLFFGRKSETEALLHLVLAENLVTVFAKSGTGKTSLIEAGLFKPLRDRFHLPIAIRFADPNFTPLEAFFLAIRKTVLMYDLQCTFSTGQPVGFLELEGMEDLRDHESKKKWLQGLRYATLWSFLKDVEIWSSDKMEPRTKSPYWPKRNKLLTPVLILDQFEEFFIDYSLEPMNDPVFPFPNLLNGVSSSLRSYISAVPGVRFAKRLIRRLRTEKAVLADSSMHPQKTEFIRQLSELVRGKAMRTEKPEGAQDPAAAGFSNVFDGSDAGLAGANASMESAAMDSGRDDRPRIKIVVSMREDFLGELEKFSTLMPEFYHKRFRLTAMTGDSALKAITEPAGLGGAGFNTLPFTYSEDSLKLILGFLSKVRKRGRLVQSDEIEPFQLQLICSHVENRIRAEKWQAGRTVESDFLGGVSGLKKIQEAFYDSRIESLPGPLNKRRARKICETGLIGSSGQRMSREESELHESCRSTPELLKLLVKHRLLRTDERAGSLYYELSHDSMVEPILASKAKRFRRNLMIGLCLVVTAFTYIGYMSGSNSGGADQVAINDSLSQINDSLSMLNEQFRKKDSILAEYRNRAQKLFEHNDTIGAANIYIEALTEYPEDRETLLLMQNLQTEKLFDFKSGYQYAQKVYSLYPDDLEAQINFAEASVLFERTGDAVQVADIALRNLNAMRADSNPELLMLRSVVHAIKSVSFAHQGKQKAFREEIQAVQTGLANLPDSVLFLWASEGIRRFIHENPKFSGRVKKQLLSMFAYMEGRKSGSRRPKDELKATLAP